MAKMMFAATRTPKRLANNNLSTAALSSTRIVAARQHCHA